MSNELMKTIVVGMDSAFVNQWDFIRDFTVGLKNDTSCRIVINSSPNIEYREGELIANFDFFIGAATECGLDINKKLDTHLLSMWAVKNPTKVYTPVRYSKVGIQVEVAEACEDLGLKYFIGSLKSSYVRIGSETTVDYPYQAHAIPNRYLIKPLYGARGIGQILFTRKTSVFALAKKVSKLVEKLRNTPDLTNDLAKELVADFPSVVYSYGRERSLNEGIDVLKMGMVIEPVFDVDSEIRVLTDIFGNVHSASLRKRTAENNIGEQSGTYEQAGGINNSLDDTVYGPDCLDKFLPHYFASEVISLAKKLPPMSSLDVFTTKKDDEGEKYWGLFEFSSQYGVDNQSVDKVRHLHEECLKELLTRAFGEIFA